MKFLFAVKSLAQVAQCGHTDYGSHSYGSDLQGFRQGSSPDLFGDAQIVSIRLMYAQYCMCLPQSYGNVFWQLLQ